MAWLDWWDDRRLHSTIGNVPPAEHEARHDRHNPASRPAAMTNMRTAGIPGRLRWPARQGLLEARRSRGVPYDEFARTWLQRKPDDAILKHFGSWPEGAVLEPLYRP